MASSEPAAVEKESRRLTLKPFKPGAKRVVLRFRGVEHTPESLAVRIFIEAPDANAQTPTSGNDHFAGTFYTYGHGMAATAPVQIDSEASMRWKTPVTKSLEPFDTLLDISKAIARLRPSGETLPLTLVVVDPAGKPLPAARFKFAEIYAEQR